MEDSSEEEVERLETQADELCRDYNKESSTDDTEAIVEAVLKPPPDRSTKKEVCKVKKVQKKRTPRGAKYREDELTYLGQLVKKYQPISGDEWENVTRKLNKQFDNNRQSLLVKRRFMKACNKRPPSGDPEMATVIQICKEAKQAIIDRCHILDGADKEDDDDLWGIDPEQAAGDDDRQSKENDENGTRSSEPSPLVRKGPHAHHRHRHHKTKKHGKNGDGEGERDRRHRRSILHDLLKTAREESQTARAQMELQTQQMRVMMVMMAKQSGLDLTELGLTGKEAAEEGKQAGKHATEEGKQAGKSAAEERKQAAAEEGSSSSSSSSNSLESGDDSSTITESE